MSRQTTSRQVEGSDRRRFGRRVRFSVAVLVAQVLLISTAIALCVQMALIKMYGEVYIVEPNSAILMAEIVATIIIVIYSATVFALQWKRLGERRSHDE
jgi:hypothetical protein